MRIPVPPIRQLAQLKKAAGELAAEAAVLADKIADFAEPPMKEFRSAAAIEHFLFSHGAKVSKPWQGMPTAFHAQWGSTGPVIAILAEYDALPDCGELPGQYGHGCGHNLLGAGSALAGILAASLLARFKVKARVVVLGTPAEEALSGKVIMAEKGAFRGLDAVLAWHPAGGSEVKLAGGAAMDSILYRFRGKTSHAAAAPEKGRSALDAAMLMDVAVNYLREHVPENCRIHSVLTRGGSAPNVVPDLAEIWYYLRGKDRKQVDDLRRRVNICARAGAMASETRLEVLVQDSVTERIPNQPLADLLDAVMRRLGPPRFGASDQSAAGKILPGKKYPKVIKPMQTKTGRASSDEANVSFFAPMAVFDMACLPEGLVPHNREVARASRLPGAHRGMVRAAEVMAAAAVQLALHPRLLSWSKAEFRRQMKGKVYRLPRCRRMPLG